MKFILSSILIFQSYYFRLLDNRESPKEERREHRDMAASSSAVPQQHQEAPRQTFRSGFHPDNSCCFCLTLRSGTGIIAGLQCVFYLGIVIWYLSTSSLDIGGIRDGDVITSLDMSLFSVCVVMIMVNILLMFAAIKEAPCQTLPWLCANTIVIIMAKVTHLGYHLRPFTSISLI